MASTAEATRLTEAHRTAQVNLGRAVVAQMLTAWAVLKADDLAGTVPRWLALAVPLLGAQAARSAALATSYVTTFRALELGSVEPFRPPAPTPPPVEQLRRSLLITGPYSLEGSIRRGVPVDRAVDVAATRAARAGSRLALDGGRQVVQATVLADRRALGFARVTSGSACAFCAMLASRGPAYKSEGSGRFEAHDGCGCTVEPIYSRRGAETAQARRYAEQWRRATKGLSGDDAVKAFRQVHEGRAVTLGPLADTPQAPAA